MSSPPSKRHKTTSTIPPPPYELLYWPTIPGRGESIRLCFEATSTPYIDVCNASRTGTSNLLSLLSGTGDATNPPPFAPPVLKHGDLMINQLPNILLYIGPRLGLAGSDGEDEGGREATRYHVNQLALTALDGLSNEAHDVHHPVAVGAYYEEQKAEAKRRAEDYIAHRLPKFLGYFERVLRGKASKGGEWLVGGQLTYADLVLWQCLDGVRYAFPRAVERLREEGEYEKVWGLYERITDIESIKSYLNSERRLDYGNGIWRHYPELDE